MKVEICEDMSCVMFDATGQTLCEVILEESGYDEKYLTGLCSGKTHRTGCILEEQKVRDTGELVYSLYIGKAYKKYDC